MFIARAAQKVPRSRRSEMSAYTTGHVAPDGAETIFGVSWL